MGVQSAQHRTKHLAYKSGSFRVENIIKVRLQDLEEGVGPAEILVELPAFLQILDPKCGIKKCC